jgi:hypothetical protein
MIALSSLLYNSAYDDKVVFSNMIKTIKKGLIFNLIAAAALLLTVLAAAGCTERNQNRGCDG